jgi:hypothetical protein
MAYKFVIKAHESSHVPEGLSATKKNAFRFFKTCLRSTGAPVK